MTLEQQVTSLELSKRLKELGVKQESYFVWANYIGQPPNFESSWTLYPSDSEDWGNQEAREHIAAFTVAELGEMLPGELDGGVWYWHECSPRGSVKNWLEWFEDEDGDKKQLDGQSHEWLISAHTEADARAKMLVYLLENKLITL